MHRFVYLLWIGVGLILWGCNIKAPSPNYSLAQEITAGKISAEFTARRSDQKKITYRAASQAFVHIRRQDLSAGLLTVELSVDSVEIFGSERDSQELAFMQRRLRHFKAVWRMAPKGKVVEFTEDPELPRGDFTMRFAPLFAAVLPVFPDSQHALALVDTQSLFNPAATEEKIIKTQIDGDQKSGEWVLGERVLKTSLVIEKDLLLELSGNSQFRFNPVNGFLKDLRVELQGEIPPDSALAGIPFTTEVRLRLRFEVLESLTH